MDKSKVGKVTFRGVCMNLVIYDCLDRIKILIDDGGLDFLASYFTGEPLINVCNMSNKELMNEVYERFSYMMTFEEEEECQDDEKFIEFVKKIYSRLGEPSYANYSFDAWNKYNEK